MAKPWSRDFLTFTVCGKCQKTSILESLICMLTFGLEKSTLCLCPTHCLIWPLTHEEHREIHQRGHRLDIVDVKSEKFLCNYQGAGPPKREPFTSCVCSWKAYRMPSISCSSRRESTSDEPRLPMVCNKRHKV